MTSEKCAYCGKAAEFVVWDVDDVVILVCGKHVGDARAACCQMPGAWHVEQLSESQEAEAEDGEFQ